ncbi:MAG: MATE family efflux transporter, partial [Myxococcota bacterium]
MLRRVLTLAIPAIAQMLLHTLVFLVDRAMLGRFSDDALASMQISGPLTWASVSILGAFVAGTMAVVGRAVGAGDRDTAGAATRASLLFGLGSGLVLGGLGLLLIGPILFAFPEAGDGARAAADGYLSVIFPSVPLLLLSMISGASLTAAGDTRTPFAISALGNAVNVSANYVLIFGKAGFSPMGAEGAALASAMAVALQCLLFFAWLLRRNSAVSIRGRGGETDAFRRMLRVALPSFAEKLLQQAGYFGYVLMVGALGTLAMASNQALISIEAVSFLSADGLGIAAGAIVAQCLGSKDPSGASRAGWIGSGLAVLLLGAFGLLFLLAPRLLLGAFSDDPAIVEAGVPCLLVAAAAQPFMAVAVVLSESLRGAGATKTVLGVMAIGGVFIRLSATYVYAFELDLGLLGVWLGSTTD